MKTILVPTDFSANALIAARYAAQLANATGQGLKLLNSFMELYAGFDGDKGSEKVIAQMRDKATAQMEELLQLLQAEFDIAIIGECVGGYAVDTIVKRIKEDSYSMVVMGTKGASNLADKMLGSTTYEIIAQSVIPVLAVPATVGAFKLDKIGFFTAYHESDINTLLRFRHTFGHGLNIQMIHLYGAHDQEPVAMTEKWTAKIANEFPGEDFTFRTVRVAAVNSDTVAHIVDTEALDLVVFTRPHKSFFTKIFVKSLTKDVAINLHVPSVFING